MRNVVYVITVSLIAALFAGCSKKQITQETLADVANDKKKELKLNTATYIKGVSGHPLPFASGTITRAYNSVLLDSQMLAVKNVGATYYRVGLGSRSDGSSFDEQRLHSLKAAANRNGIQLLANIPLTGLNTNTQTESNAYDAGRHLGGAVVHRYPTYFNYYEIGNEYENKLLIPGNSGKYYSHYDTTKMKIAVSFMKGVHDGVKAEKPAAKTMINAGWVHWGYMDYVVQKIDLDIIAWHWYSQMEVNTNGSGTSNIAETLYGKYARPIWFTEINQTNGSAGSYKGKTGEDGQVLFLTEFGNKMQNNPYVEAIFVYELFDESAHNTPTERNFGMYKWTTPYTVYTEKKAVSAFKGL